MIKSLTAERERLRERLKDCCSKEERMRVKAEIKEVERKIKEKIRWLELD